MNDPPDGPPSVMQSWRNRLPPADSNRAVTFQPWPALLQALHLFKHNSAARASEGLLRLFFYLLRTCIGCLRFTIESDGVAEDIQTLRPQVAGASSGK
ncbi:MAG: hypothetical protein ACTHLN_03735 [Tepidisphaeraceae bacterium]